MFLFQLNQTISSLKNIGPAKLTLFEGLGITTIYDLLTFYPRKYKNKKELVSVKESLQKKIPSNTKICIIKSEFIGNRYKKDLKLFAVETSSNTPIAIPLFGRGFLQDKYMAGAEFYLYGQATQNNFEISFSSCDLEPAIVSDKSEFGHIVPVYHQKKGLTSKYVAKTISRAWSMYAQYLIDELPDYLIERDNLLSISQALKHIHFPSSFDLLEKARESLKVREIFLLYLKIQYNSRPVAIRGLVDMRSSTLDLQKKAIAGLEFELTEDQKSSLAQINSDMLSERVMYRLLQGDVGAGKTVVAFLSALLPLSLNQQVALVVPTELLARQHYQSARAFFSKLGIEVGFLTGSNSSSSRDEIFSKIEKNEINLIIGTHALFGDRLKYANLKYVIIDEQQKFGVEQRDAIQKKGENPDILLMSATPIPRTLALAFYSDLNISEIRQKPEGRLTIKTHLALHENSHKVYDFVEQQLQLGRQAYFVYPLIRDSAAKSLKSASTMFSHLQSAVFPGRRLALVHSELPEEEKELAMEEFSQGKVDILVATSVLEVGIDNKNASCIVIEDAQQFGLSSLHQLRGRVGRGKYQSYAFLIYSEDLTDSGKQRILAMKESCDGFKLAEEDLKIRGFGEIDGKKQSGLSSFTLTDLQKDIKMLRIIKEEVSALLENTNDKHLELLLSNKEYFSNVLVTY
ncbi:MAG: ATP-dependent DNA helicase RecG [Spirochaetales bacterium]|nr:ATP-dependent DNA helicase RecG [Spirochaetales bacterium]